MPSEMDSDWVSFSLTHVEYPKGDILGLILAVISLLPLAILTGFVTLILFRRDLHTMTFLVGQLGNEVLNMILKRTIRQPRPMRRETNYTEWGMPSSHSQFVSFFVIYSSLFILLRLPALRLKYKMGVVAFLQLLWALVAYSRIYLMYHTWAQVGWGSVIGVGSAVVWFLLTRYLFTPIFPKIANLPVCEFLQIKDTTLIPNILWFEYQTARGEAKSRARKIGGSKTN